MESVRGKMVQVQQNEIDLIDLFKILYKGKRTILITWLLVSGVSLAVMLYMKGNEKTRIYKEVRTENIDLTQFKTSEIDIRPILKQGKEISCYEVGGFEGQINETEIDEKITEISTAVEEKKQEQLKGLSTSYDLKLRELKSLNKEFNRILTKEPKELYGNEKMIEILNEKHPIFMVNYKNVKTDYEELELEKRSFMDQEIESISEVKNLKLKSKGNLIGIAGIILGFILGITAVFMKEFWFYLKKELEKK